jgi:hypothetical protein
MLAGMHNDLGNITPALHNCPGNRGSLDELRPGPDYGDYFDFITLFIARYVLSRSAPGRLCCLKDD